MATTQKTLVQTAYVSSSMTAVYTVPGSTKAIIKEIILCNITTSEQTVTVLTVNTGGGSTDASAIMKDLAIPAKTSIWLEGITTIMEASSELRAQAANASSVTIRVSGVEIS